MIMLMKTLIVENPRVGGSIPPLAPFFDSNLDSQCSMAALSTAKYRCYSATASRLRKAYF